MHTSVKQGRLYSQVLEMKMEIAVAASHFWSATGIQNLIIIFFAWHINARLG